MNQSNQVAVELRLLLDKLRKDTKAAAEILRTGLAAGAQGVATGTEKAGKEMEKLEVKTRKATKAIQDQKKAALDAWRASLPAPQVRGVGFDQPVRGGGGTGSWSTTAGGGLATQPPNLNRYSGPVPPVIPPPRMGMAQQAAGLNTALRSAMSTPLAVAAQVGAAFAGLRVVLGLFKFAIEGVLGPLRAMMHAAEAARGTYAKALTGGMGLGYASKTGLLASIIGVSEDQVMQFGGAVGYLNGKVQFASETFAQTNQKLTALSWEFRVLTADIAALTAKLAYNMQPSLVMLIRVVDASARSIGFMIDALRPLMKLAGMVIPGMGGVNKAFGHSGGPSAPTPTSSINRMASSAWERMGLVLGNGGSSHMEKIKNNTARMADYLKIMAGRYVAPQTAGAGVTHAAP